VEEGIYRWLAGLGIPVVTILTKADKLSRSRRAARLRELAASLPGTGPVVFSAQSGLGKTEVLKCLEGLLEGRPSGEGDRRGAVGGGGDVGP